MPDEAHSPGASGGSTGGQSPFGQSPFGRPFGQPPPQRSTQLLSSIKLCPDMARLAAVVGDSQATMDAQELLAALHRATRLEKLRRQHVKLEQQLQQRRRQGADAGGDAALYALQQQHAQQLTATLDVVLPRLAQSLDGLGAEQLVQVLSCLATLGATGASGGTALLLSVLQQLEGRLGMLPGRRLAELAMALAKLNATNLDAQRSTPPSSPAGGAAADADAASAGSSSSEQQAAAEAARSLLVGLCAAVQQRQAGMDAGSLATFVRAMARLQFYDWPTMRHVCALLPAHAQGLNPDSISKLLVGCTMLHHFDPQLCSLLAAAAQRCMGEASGPQVAQIAWSLAHQRFEEPGVYQAAALQATARAHELGPRQVANLAWAFAVRKAYDPALYDALAQRATELLASSSLVETGGVSAGGGAEAEEEEEGGAAAEGGEGGEAAAAPAAAAGGAASLLLAAEGQQVLPQHLCLVAWSFAKQGHRADTLMQLLGDKAAAMPGQWMPQNISNIAWAFGCLGVPHAALFGALSGAARACHLDGFNQQNITDLVWGCVAAGHQDPKLMELAARATTARLAELSPHSLSDLIWAFAAARATQAPQVLAAAAPVAGACLERFNTGMLADLLWSYAAVGVKDEGLLEAVEKVLVLPDRLAALEADTEAQAKTIWALKTLQHRAPALEAALSAVVPGLEGLLGST